MRREKGQIRVCEGMIPNYAAKHGINIIDPLIEFQPPPRFPVWQPPVDDPRFLPPPAPEEHPDYHRDAIYNFTEMEHLIEGQRQVEILTKTQIIDGLPDKVVKNIGKVTIPRQDEMVQRYIMQANVWAPNDDKITRWRLPETPRGWHFKAEKGIIKKDTNNMLMQNMTRLCQSLNTLSSDLGTSRRVTKHHQISMMYTFRADKHIKVDADHNMFISSTRPLTSFASANQVQATSDYVLPDLYPIEPTIDINKVHIYKEGDITGWKTGSTPHYPHTILHNHRDYWKLHRKNAKAIMFAFANCALVAKAKYGPDVKVLPEPVCTQWVGFDEDTLHFLCYQLNTMDFSNDDGVKNLCWLNPAQKLYNKILPKRAMLRNTKYEDYDSEVLHKFIAMYLTDVNVDALNENLQRVFKK